ncbi:MAG: CPBP family intramembrane metalloprotease [Ferruginibacter sp.]|nr:CPBP family intramembrane metalloprotease [Ferruginibacter sp.]
MSVAVLVTVLLLNKLVYGKGIKTSFNDIGLRKTNLPGLVPGIFISAALLCAYPLLGVFLNIDITLADGWQLNIIGLMFTAGVAEEILFRGYLFGGLRRNMNFRKAAFISTICFALAHLVMFTYMDWPVALLSTLLAVATCIPLAFLFEKGNNTVWSPAIVHTAIRTVGLVVTTDEKHFMQFSMLWITACMILPYTVLILYKEFRTIWTKRS